MAEHSYTLSELVAMSEASYRQDKALIQKCIEGLTLHAAQIAQTAPQSVQVVGLRMQIENLVYYWGISDDATAIKRDYLQRFDDLVSDPAACKGVEVTAGHCASIVHGLHRYCMEMAVSQGSDAIDDMLAVKDLMIEIATDLKFEPKALDVMTAEIEAELNLLTTRQMEQPQMAQQMGGMSR